MNARQKHDVLSVTNAAGPFVNQVGGTQRRYQCQTDGDAEYPPDEIRSLRSVETGIHGRLILG